MAEPDIEFCRPKDELTVLKEKFQVSEEKRKLLENKVTKLKEKCKLQEDSVMETERSKLLAEYNLLMSKKKIRKLEKKLFMETKSARKCEPVVSLSSSPELSGLVHASGMENTPTPPSPNLPTQPNLPFQQDNLMLNMRSIIESGFNLRQVSDIQDGRMVDSIESLQQDDIDALSSMLKILKNMSAESIKQNEDKKIQLEVKKKILSNVKDEVKKIRQIIKLKETVHEGP